MPIKREISQGVDLNELAAKAAREMLANKPKFAPIITEEIDKLYVLETVEVSGKTKWEIISGLPFGLDPYSVYADLQDLARTKQDKRELLKRRIRRGFRDRLLAAKVLPEADAKARVLRVKITEIR